MSNVRNIIIGKLPAQLAEVFGQIEQLQGELTPPNSNVPIKDSVLNAWQRGKTGTEIAKEFRLKGHVVQRIIEMARWRGDERAPYRGGWAHGMVPGKLKLVKDDKP